MANRIPRDHTAVQRHVTNVLFSALPADWHINDRWVQQWAISLPLGHVLYSSVTADAADRSAPAPIAPLPSDLRGVAGELEVRD